MWSKNTNYYIVTLKVVEKYSWIVQALPADWAPGGEFVPTDFTRKVLTFSFFSLLIVTYGVRWRTF